MAITVKPQPEPSRGRGVRPWDLAPVFGFQRLDGRPIEVDGVVYSPDRVREILRERHALAEDNTRLRLWVKQLQNTARQKDVHLKARTAALVRIIASTRQPLR